MIGFVPFLVPLVLIFLCAIVALQIGGEFLAFRVQRRRAIFHVFHCDRCDRWSGDCGAASRCVHCGSKLNLPAF
jgi:hypothetical protein